jgi:hypothetical protein
MSEKLTNQQAYELHLMSWADAGIKPSKEEVDELEYLYKVGRYTPKKGKK